MRTALIGIVAIACMTCAGCILTERVQNPDGTYGPSPVEQAISGGMGGMGGGWFGAAAGGLGGLIAGLGAALRQRKGKERMLGQVASGVGEYLKDTPNYAGKSAEEIAELEKARLKALLAEKTDRATKEFIALLKSRLNIG